MTLRSLLLNNKNSRKIFGKCEIDIILKQLDGVSLSQSEKNRLSRNVRPKLEIISELSEFRGDFKLKKNQDNKRLIQKAVDEILKHELKNNIKAILLFGSFADKTFNYRSDIDICVIFRERISLKDSTRFRIRIMGRLDRKVDIQVFNTLPQKVKKSIMRNHRVLFRTKDYDDIIESIEYIKDNDYFIRLKNIFGVEA